MMPLAMTFYPHERVFTDSPVELLSLVGIAALFISGLTALYRHWRATECHVPTCHKHQWKKVPGTEHIVCKRHLKSITGAEESTHDEIQAEHRAAVKALL
jgi:hypothetical protein